ncbi:RBBP9/YdeN family alpha/beta hydrolase [Pseudomonas oryzihabitans]|uniref:RBBP9/YdeN family alpha/beta hydrolase n=1 Tax=Pseudomonas oryzihabitans TaxID=47885 RepID=UPI00363DA921
MTRYLILPGWQGSGPEHWQTHWQRRLPDARRVEQDDWQRPDPQRWVAALDAAIAQANAPVVLIAHSLGCVTVARWAASAPVARRQRVLAALLVAPADVERPGCPVELVGFAPLPRQPLPFPSRVVTSDNDHAISLPRAEALAQAWAWRRVIISTGSSRPRSSRVSNWPMRLRLLRQSVTTSRLLAG